MKIPLKTPPVLLHCI